MNKINIAATGYPGTNKSWRFLHTAFSEPLKSIAKLCGDKVIITGCEVIGTDVSEGWVALKGELFYFKPGKLTDGNDTRVAIQQDVEQAAYNTDANADSFFDLHDTYFERYCQLGNGTEDVCSFGELERLQPLNQVRVKGEVIQWFGDINHLPAGFVLCDGQNGTPDLRDRFIVGAGNSYNVGDTGGENTVQLFIGNLPKHKFTGTTDSSGEHTHTGVTNYTGDHNHGYNKSAPGRGYRTNADDNPHSVYQWAYTSSSGGHAHTVTVNSGGEHMHPFTTDELGGDKAHENRPPYFALHFLMWVGI